MSKPLIATLALAAGLAAVARTQAPELQRYFKIRQM